MNVWECIHAHPWIFFASIFSICLSYVISIFLLSQMGNKEKADERMTKSKRIGF
jgi:hypothetical protein